ncbi:hypothetical protein K461DRAFT_319528 [Myriangium duriaei CBS 260.36]|uniref:C3H1-type domain-containing protein n=1 Tax=Myriangium duriaei CBS 260.36 TaxID=1168546 RepID=A0A9P4JA31_9PEZI|nr:hypothetical protein K461DRAFT_319528 [Myriangium duriaei CBS 260.36]
MAAPDVSSGSPLAEALQNAIQPKLAEHGWSSGAGDDSALSEYILLMVGSGKNEQQIASELATDLLGLDPSDQGPLEFAQWLFKQVSILNARLNGATESQEQASTATASRQVQDDASEDTTMGSAIDTAGAGAVPTGPKSMRNGSGAQRGRDRRMAGQMRNAMERSNDAGIHRIKGAASRINTHNRDPPSGPRGMASKMQNMMAGTGRGGQPMNSQMMANMAAGVSPQQQMALFQMLEEQSRMMAQLLNNGGQQAAINPKFFNKHGRGGKSLFERVDQPRHNGGRNKPGQSQQQQSSNGEDMDMAEDGTRKPPAEIPCKFQLQCTSPDCPFAHQSPAAAAGVSFDVSDTCSYGAACTNKKCVASHPSPAQRRQYLSSTVDCKFFPNCANKSCPFRHPSTPPCRNGADCPQKDSGCKFSHSTIMCRYNPCVNDSCVFKHAEGQHIGSQWNKDHVSERKFTSGEGEQEELIIPGQMEQDGQSGGQGDSNATNSAPVEESAMDQAEDVVA